MKKILIIQFRSLPEIIKAEQDSYRRSIKGAAAVHFISALNESLQWTTPAALLDGYDGLILGGSGEFDLDGGRSPADPMRIKGVALADWAMPLVSWIRDNDVPALGICFGHQIIARMYDGNVMNDDTQTKVGSFEVGLTPEGKEDALFGKLPGTFIAQYGHKDSVTTLPRGAVVLAIGKACKYSALRYGKSLYTVQFHPELSADDVRSRLRDSGGYLPSVPVDIAVQDSSFASTLIPRWLATF